MIIQTVIGINGWTNLTFHEHTISTNCMGALYACTIDIDLDGDVDIVTSASNSDKISWWENSDYDFTEHVIDDSFDEVIHIHVVDLDDDGDFDVMGGSQLGNELAWWENDGLIFTKHVVAMNILNAHSLYSEDIDKDGDLDLFSTSNNDISWWENDGQQIFTQHTFINRPFSSTQGFIRYIYALDLDDDTDIDFISGDNVWGSVVTVDTIYYWLSDGNQNFIQKTVEGVSYAQFHGFHVIDLDQDGDIDLLATNPSENQIDWFENDGQLNFTQYTIATNFNGANDLDIADLDKDGDLDLIAVAYFDNKISLFENDGSQNFTEEVLREDFDGAHFCMFSDINKDGLYDILGLAWEGDEVSWWEQTDTGDTSTSSTSSPAFTSSAASFGMETIVVSCIVVILLRQKRK
ncbi:MAG: FG-GAP-like repeat-containing protein [Candidatus Hodarchaeota archaeon]